MKSVWKNVLQFVLAASLIITITACGGGKKPGAPPIDPSGNWDLVFTDSDGKHLDMSALFSQSGSVVTAFHVLAAGNPSPFACVPFTGQFANGQVLNVNEFSGDIDTPFGNIHFTSTLNDAGTHAVGTYTLTGNCWAVASSGTFVGDEVPSVSGSWTGTVNCTSNCPVGPTSGTITATLTQNDTTGAVTGTYAISGLPPFSSGTVSSGQFDLLSGVNLQATLTDSSGSIFSLAGGPFSGLSPGLGQDRSFIGAIVLGSTEAAKYSVNMTH